MMLRALSLSLSLFLLVGGFSGCAREEITIRNAWIPEAPPTVSALAGYLSVENNSGETRTLVGASGALFERIEIHRTVYEQDSGLARMIREEELYIASGQSLRFEPGGYHLMLINPKKALTEGDSVTLTLLFANGSRLTVQFEVRREQLRL